MRNFIFFQQNVCKPGVKTPAQILASLRTEQVISIDIKPVIEPNFYDNEPDPSINQNIIESLRKSAIYTGNAPVFITTTIKISFMDGANITVGDSGDNIFQVDVNDKENINTFLISSDQLKTILLPYQERFKREISIKKNITLYGVQRETRIASEDANVYEEADLNSPKIGSVSQGELLRTLAKRTIEGVDWYYIDTPAFNIPNPVGWIKGGALANTSSAIMPKNGFTRKDVQIYADPSEDARVLQTVGGSSPLYINERADDWIRAGFPGGVDGWI